MSELPLVADADEGHAVGEVERALARNELPVLTAWAKGFGLGSQRLFFLGGKFEAAERIHACASENVDTVERFFWGGAKLMKICHWVSSTLPQNQFGREL